MQSSSRKKTSDKLLPDSKPLQAQFHNQKGGLLIGLIIIMVIASMLGAGMVYIVSNTSLNSISSNFSKRAYYNAEAGIRCLIAQYRNAGSSDDGRDALLYYDIGQNNEANRTITLPSGGSVVLQVDGLSGTYTPATADYDSLNGSSLTLNVTGGAFPEKIGFFKKDGANTIYRYTGSSLSGAKLTLTGVYPGIATSGGSFYTVEKAKIIAKGKFGGGIWSRTVTHEWPLSGSKGVMADSTPFVADNKDVTKFKYSQFNKDGSDIIADGVNFWRDVIAFFTGKPAQHLTGVDVMRWWFEDQGNLVLPNSGCGYNVQSWGSYQWDKGQSAIKANSSTSWFGGNGGFFLPYNYDFKAERTLGNDRLNYDAQTKMKIDGWNRRDYLVGLSVRADSRCWASGWDPVVINQYGISYAQGDNYMFNLPNKYDPFIVFWRSVGNNFKLIAYKKLTIGDGVLNGVIEPVDPMDSTTSSKWSNNSTYANNWSLDSSVGHNANGSYHVDITEGFLGAQNRAGLVRNFDFPDDVNGGTLTFWAKTGPKGLNKCTLDIRMADRNGTWIDLWAAPDSAYTPTSSWQQFTVPLQDYTGITLGRATKLEFYAKAEGLPARCDVYVDDVQLSYYKFRDWSTLGVRVREKGTSGSMSNEFEIFYGDTNSNTGTGVSVIDSARKAVARGENRWLPASPIKNNTTADKDRLTIASSDTSIAADNRWYWWQNNASLPTTSPRTHIGGEPDCDYALETGGSKEPYAVIKTSGSNCQTTDKYYTGTNTPEEFAIHIYSKSTWNTWFDDTNILATNRSSQFTPGIQY